MRTILFFSIALLSFAFINAQAFEGSGDQKFQVGAELQDNGTGINVGYDVGLGENVSIGATTSYLLGVEELLNAGFVDRFDAKARVNVHLGSTIGFGDNFDVFPGLELSLKNFGMHFGARYFFSDGIGVYAQVGHPIARYKSKDRSLAEELHNQLVINFGLSLNFL
jgi:hypothetical protein